MAVRVPYQIFLGQSADLLPHIQRHDADAVEWRTVDQLGADHGVDQHMLFRIERAVDLKALEEQRRGREANHLRPWQVRWHADRTDSATCDREAARVLGKPKPAFDAPCLRTRHVAGHVLYLGICFKYIHKTVLVV